jgi:uncharacterized protein YkwD
MRFRPRGRRVAVVLLFSVASLAFGQAAGAARFSGSELRLVRSINQVRRAHLAPPLRLDMRLERAAHAHSRDMLAHNYFGHGQFTARLRRFGVLSPLLGENLAWSSGASVDPGTIVQMWMDSPEHRQIMLLRGFHRIGLGMPVGPFAGYPAAVVLTADFSA